MQASCHYCKKGATDVIVVNHEKIYVCNNCADEHSRRKGYEL